MAPRTPDGSAGDADYGTIGRSYSTYRQAEPQIAALIEQDVPPRGGRSPQRRCPPR
jgi:hypothetical protein